MPGKRVIKLRCPICKKPAKAGDPDFPFCSDRCRQIDLGKWASGQYVIPVEGGEFEDDPPTAILRNLEEDDESE